MNDAQKEAAICKYIRGAPTSMYDIGVGPKTEWITLPRRYPDMKLFGCEPHPEQYEALLSRKFPGILARVAIGWPEGQFPLYYTSKDQKVSSLLPTPYATEHTDVKVWSLDRFDATMGCPDRILLWMDIEGGELTALRSGPKLMESGRVRWINVEERNPGQKQIPGWCDPAELRAFLLEHGFVHKADYNRHATHHDAIYVHKDELAQPKEA